MKHFGNETLKWLYQAVNYSIDNEEEVHQVMFHVLKKIFKFSGIIRVIFIFTFFTNSFFF